MLRRLDRLLGWCWDCVIGAVVLLLVVSRVCFADTSGVRGAPGPIFTGGATVAYDFGERRQGGTGVIEHAFALTNGSSSAVTIERLTPSCGCTNATIRGAGLPAVVAPGRSVTVDVSIDPLRLMPGAVDKTVAVFVSGQSAPTKTLEMRGEFSPLVSFSPNLLNFGDVASGEIRTLKLSATMDKTACPPDLLQFVSSDSDISADKVSETPSGKNEEIVTYDVKLSKSPFVGVIDGSVSLGIPDGHSGLTMVGTPLPIHGSVVGKVTAAPMSVTFANVPAGQATTRDVLLNGISPADIANVKASSDSALITVELIPTLPGVCRMVCPSVASRFEGSAMAHKFAFVSGLLRFAKDVVAQ